MNKIKIAHEILKIAAVMLADKDGRYTKPDGTFKKMTPVEGEGKKSKFNGCVRAMMAKGYPQENAERICANIARQKGAA